MPKFRVKKGYGSIYFQGADGKPVRYNDGDVIECKAGVLDALMDKVEVIEDAPAAATAPPPSFSIVNLGHGYFNVIHPATGKPINSKSLRKADAEALAGLTVEEYEARLAAERKSEEGEPGGDNGEPDGGADNQ